MTDGYVTPERGGTARHLKAALENARHMSMSYRQAAHECAVSFKWLYRNEWNCMPLLDYDVICWALPSLHVEQMLTAPSTEVSEVGLDHNIFSGFSGPACFRYLLTTMREFVLPPGTVSEMLWARREALKKNISDLARTFLSELEQVRGRAELVPDRAAFAKWLLRDGTKFESDIRDLALVDNLLHRAKPAEKVMSRDSSGAGHAFSAMQDVYHHLQGQRRDRSINNLADAINASMMVQIFESRKEFKFIPLLISNTPALDPFKTRLLSFLDTRNNERLTQTAERLPPLFGRPEYLVLWHSFTERMERRYKAAAWEAEEFEADAAGLEQAHEKLLNRCNIALRGKPDDYEIKLEELEGSELSTLLLRRREFKRKWGEMLGPPASALSHDKRSFLNILKSDELRVRHLARGELVAKLTGIVEQEGRARGLDYDMWQILLEHSPPDVAHLEADYYSITFGESDGELLSVPRSADQPLTNLNAEIMRGNHDLEVRVTPAMLSAAGPALVVSSFRDDAVSSERYVQLVWLHKLERTAACSLCIEVIRNLDDANTDLLLGILSTQAGARVARSSPRELLEAVIADTAVQAFEVRTGTISVFADLADRDGVELQFGVTMAASRWKQGVLKKLEEAVVLSNANPLPGPHFLRFARQCIDQLKSAAGDGPEPARKSA